MISVVIPALNEADAIEATLEAVAATLNADERFIGWEVIVVDDGSADGTGHIAALKGATVVRHPQKAGYGRSLKDGIAAARNELIAITDADGTYPIDRIPALVAEIDRGFDMAVGARTGSEYRESFLKAPMRKLLTLLVEFTSGCRIPDTNSGLRVFRKSTAMRFFPQLCNTFSFTTSMTLAFLLSGLFISYIEIPYFKRIGKTKVRLFHDSLRTLQYIVQAIVFYNPIKLFLVLALVVAVPSLLLLLLNLLTESLACLVLGSAGLATAILVFALGLLADLIKQVETRV